MIRGDSLEHEEEETPMLQLSPFKHTAAVDHELLPEVSVIDDHNDTIRT
ncbi:hypothetical protein Tco_0482732, partial [Tanacetum coccineum]